MLDRIISIVWVFNKVATQCIERIVTMKFVDLNLMFNVSLPLVVSPVPIALLYVLMTALQKPRSFI